MRYQHYQFKFSLLQLGHDYLFFLLAHATHIQLSQLNSQMYTILLGLLKFLPTKAVIKISHKNGCI